MARVCGQRGVEQIAQALELNEAQQTTLRTAMQNAAQAQQGGGGDRRSAMRQARQQALAALEPSLSAHQRELLAAYRENGGSREVRRQAVVWVLRDDKPTPVQVEVGIADNGFTVLLGGDLEEGDEVIIGGGPTSTAPAQGGMGGPPGGGVRIRGA